MLSYQNRDIRENGSKTLGAGKRIYQRSEISGAFKCAHFELEPKKTKG